MGEEEDTEEGTCEEEGPTGEEVTLLLDTHTQEMSIIILMTRIHPDLIMVCNRVML